MDRASVITGCIVLKEPALFFVDDLRVQLRVGEGSGAGPNISESVPGKVVWL